MGAFAEERNGHMNPMSMGVVYTIVQDARVRGFQDKKTVRCCYTVNNIHSEKNMYTS